MKVKAYVEKGGSKSYACRLDNAIDNCLAIGYGSSAREAIEDLKEVFAEYDEMNDTDKFSKLEVEYRFDVGSLFDYYDFLKIEGIAKLTGIKASVLRQYVSGVRKPKEDRLQQIQDGVHEAAVQLNGVML